MAPPPLLDLFDWRVPYVDVLAMICVSCVYACEELFDGLRAPPFTGLPSPAPRASGAATSTDVTTQPASRYFPGLRMRILSDLLHLGDLAYATSHSQGCCGNSRRARTPSRGGTVTP